MNIVGKQSAAQPRFTVKMKKLNCLLLKLRKLVIYSFKNKDLLICINSSSTIVVALSLKTAK